MIISKEWTDSERLTLIRALSALHTLTPEDLLPRNITERLEKIHFLTTKTAAFLETSRKFLLKGVIEED